MSFGTLSHMGTRGPRASLMSEDFHRSSLRKPLRSNWPVSARPVVTSGFSTPLVSADSKATR
eukprot:14563855-Alexandrium_andersonii.AAC.1